MLVSDLITALQDLPPDMTVMMDVTAPGANAFHFKECVSVEELEMATGERYVVVSVFDNDDEHPINQN